MTTINPNTGPGSDRLNPTIQTTLNRLGRALTIRDTSGESSAKTGDSVQISPAAASASASAATSIADIGVLLADLETLVAQAAQDNAGADIRADAQRRIDEVVAMISETAAQAGAARGILGPGDPRPANVTEVRDGVVDISILQNDLAYRTSFDVVIEILEPAERAGFLLSFGGANIDLGAGSNESSSFVFEVSGAIGTRTLSFASGTSVLSIVAAINTFEDVTGVRAQVSGTAVRLESQDFGESEFISVKIVDDGTIQGGGIYEVQSFGNGDPYVRYDSPVTSYYSSAASNGLIDRGKDLVVDSPGLFLETDGAVVTGSIFADIVEFQFRVESDNFGATLPWNGFYPFELLHVFTITGDADTEVGGPIDDVPLGSASPVVEALTPYTTAGANTGDFAAALDAIRSLRDQFSGGVTDESLADLRRDLIARAGAALDITAPSSAQQALDLLGGGITP